MTRDDPSSSKREQTEKADPLDEETGKISTAARPGSTPSDSSSPSAEPELDPSNTTIWGGAPPPRIFDDEDATVVSAIPPVDPDATETMVAGVPSPPNQIAPIAPSSSLRPMLLERIEPSVGRGERLRLDAAHWQVSLGRAEESDIRLYTASASREHASIAGNEKGEWVLSPVADKSVQIDGELLTEPIVLEAGMNILLGQDHLRCVTEGIERSASVAATVAEGFADPSGWKGFRLANLGVLGAVGLALGVATLIGIVWAVLTWFVDH